MSCYDQAMIIFRQYLMISLYAIDYHERYIMKSKAVAITPKKLASSLRDFQDSNIKPIQQSLDKTQEILTTIVESIKHSPSTDTRSDPFIEQLRGPMPAI